MSEPNQLLDETLDFNKSSQYRLSILIRKNGLSFIILDTVSQKIIAFKEIEVDAFDHYKEYCYFVNKAFKSEAFLEYDYKSISVIYQSFTALSIPVDLYSAEHKRTYFALNTEVADDEAILSNDIPQLEAKKLFTIPKALYEIIKEHFPGSTIYHQTAPVIQSVYKEQVFETVYLNIHPDFFDIQIFNAHEMLLDNAFKFETKEDLLYYIVYTFEQLGIDPKTQKTILFSELKHNDELIELLKDYFGGLKLAQLPESYTYSYLFSKEDHHQLAAQISVFGCE